MVVKDDIGKNTVVATWPRMYIRHCSHAKAGKLLLQFYSKEGKAEFLTSDDLTLRDVSAGSIV